MIMWRIYCFSKLHLFSYSAHWLCKDSRQTKRETCWWIHEVDVSSRTFKQLMFCILSVTLLYTGTRRAFLWCTTGRSPTVSMTIELLKWSDRRRVLWYWYKSSSLSTLSAACPLVDRSVDWSQAASMSHCSQVYYACYQRCSKWVPSDWNLASFSCRPTVLIMSAALPMSTLGDCVQHLLCHIVHKSITHVTRHIQNEFKCEHSDSNLASFCDTVLPSTTVKE